jgi:hypothetical protein
MSDADKMRGIQNVEARYPTAEDRHTAHSEDRLLSTNLKRHRNKKSRSNTFEENDEAFSNYTKKLNGAEAKRLYNNVRTILRGGDVGFGESDTRELIEMRVSKVDLPSFPYFIFGISVVKDLLDVPANLSLIGVPLAMALSFLISLILFFWIWGKASGGWWKKGIIKWLFVRFVFCCAIELLPIGSIIPAVTIFTLMAHYRETKIVKLVNLALEELHHAGIK